MALKKLGSSYMVGNSKTASSVGDDTYYRGYKDFLLWADGPTSFVLNVIGKSSDTIARDLTATLYSCTNLLSDPGESLQTACEEVPAGGTSDPLTLSRTISTGLYRLRMIPGSTKLFYTVSLGGIKWYALECLETRFGYHIWGQTNTIDPPYTPPAVTQYFFVPQLPDGDTVRIRLQSDKFKDKAKMRIFRGTEELDSLETYGDEATGDEHPFLNTLELSGDDLPSEGPGEVYSFVLSLPGRDNQGPSGDAWVRFSKNIPPYFSNDPDRLIYPIIHRDFEPVVTTGSTVNYRAYLTVPRSETDIIALGGRIRLQVGDTVGSSTINAYTLGINFSPESQAELTGSQVNARIQNGDIVVADSTDKVNSVWITQPAEFGSDWPSALKHAYDNANGVGTADTLFSAGFNTIQTNNPCSLDDIVGPTRDGMKAAGALYGNDGAAADTKMKQWFDASDENAGSDKIRFWMMLDEPDAPVDVILMKDLYAMYYEYNSRADKPYALNISQPVLLEEFSRGCDVLISDPFVYPKKGTGTGTQTNQGRITDVAAELKYLVGDTKKSVIVLFWWYPPDGSTASTGATYGASFDLAKDEVDGLSGFNFAGGGQRLSSYDAGTPPEIRRVIELWNMTKCKNQNWTPPL